jgi:hypothetical protein
LFSYNILEIPLKNSKINSLKIVGKIYYKKTPPPLFNVIIERELKRLRGEGGFNGFPPYIAHPTFPLNLFYYKNHVHFCYIH